MASTPRIFDFYDQLSAFEYATNATARWANRGLLLGLILFTLSLPHSIAATWISLSVCIVGWLVRDIALRKFHGVCVACPRNVRQSGGAQQRQVDRRRGDEQTLIGANV